METLLTPKFLTHAVAEEAAKMVINTVFDSERPKRFAGHLVVLGPAMEDAREEDYPDYPNYPIVPKTIFEMSVGEMETWEHDYEDVAKCKALQLWTNRNVPESTDVQAHLLFPGDTPYWGGVRRHGIVVAFSGIQPWFDQLIAGMVADAIKAIAHDELEKEKSGGIGDFLE